MADQEIRNKLGKLIGRIRETSGVLEIRDAAGKLLGKYNPKINTTRDAAGKLIGKGNLLTSLLKY